MIEGDGDRRDARNAVRDQAKRSGSGEVRNEQTPERERSDKVTLRGEVIEIERDTRFDEKQCDRGPCGSGRCRRKQSPEGRTKEYGSRRGSGVQSLRVFSRKVRARADRVRDERRPYRNHPQGDGSVIANRKDVDEQDGGGAQGRERVRLRTRF